MFREPKVGCGERQFTGHELQSVGRWEGRSETRESLWACGVSRSGAPLTHLQGHEGGRKL